MQARTIVTSHPDVACDVCERRLLRGEHPDVFIVAGDRRLVCELCVPRAVQEGWQRESERGMYELAPPKPRRGRGLLERLFGAARAQAQGRVASGRAGEKDPSGAGRPEQEPSGSRLPEREPAGAEQPEPDPFEQLAAEGVGSGAVPADGQLPPPAEAPLDPLQMALDAFNAGEYPRRISGVARSLGAPRVSVRCAEHAASVIVIVVAWELCWYRYEVDLDELELEARATAQGTELDELAREDLRDNAGAHESGLLALVHAS
jgi:hypothetical protein